MKQPRESSDTVATAIDDPLMTNMNDLGINKQHLKSKIIVHRRINKTFAANTPEQSCDKPKPVVATLIPGAPTNSILTKA